MYSTKININTSVHLTVLATCPPGYTELEETGRCYAVLPLGNYTSPSEACEHFPQSQPAAVESPLISQVIAGIMNSTGIRYFLIM